MPTGTGQRKKKNLISPFPFSKPKTHLLCTFFSYAHVVSQANLSRSLPSRPTAHLTSVRLGYNAKVSSGGQTLQSGDSDIFLPIGGRRKRKGRGEKSHAFIRMSARVEKQV